MTKPPSAQEFKLTIDQNPASPKLSVEDLSARGQPQVLATAIKLPLYLAIDHAADTHAELVVRLASAGKPFDPALTHDDNVLAVETELSDVRFDTQDDTRYIVHLTNRSQHYVADGIHVTVGLARRSPIGQPERDPGTLPDGNVSLDIMPREQHIECIKPGAAKSLEFVAVARGTRAGLYLVDITLRYQLLYWDGREARATSQHILPVQSREGCFEAPRVLPAARMPRQPSPPRNTTMSDSDDDLTPDSSEPRQRTLEPIRERIELPGGGCLDVCYRLTKNNHPNQDTNNGSHCRFGLNPRTNQIESYFSTADTAALEVTLQNNSPHDLKHVRLGGVKVYTNGKDNAPAKPVEKRHDDGNLFFEVVPDQLYYGHIDRGSKETRYASIITRYVSPGKYKVHMDVHYDIEQCKVPVKLELRVKPD